MTLDILSPRGQQTLTQEADAVALFEQRYPQVKYVATRKDQPATVDAVLVKNTVELVGVVETKCRQTTLDTFQRQFGSAWLVTWDKIDESRRIAAALSVPLYGFLYLVPDRVLLVAALSDVAGSLTKPVRVEATETQRTVNGGKAIRNNAYIDMSAAQVISRPRIA